MQAMISALATEVQAISTSGKGDFQLAADLMDAVKKYKDREVETVFANNLSA